MPKSARFLKNRRRGSLATQEIMAAKLAAAAHHRYHTLLMFPRRFMAEQVGGLR